MQFNQVIQKISQTGIDPNYLFSRDHESAIHRIKQMCKLKNGEMEKKLSKTS